ncbi:MAG: polysaccharide biosynthesis tyrosine autokinase [Bacteroidia bacterium]|nr:polysaccharide biosynthesis tyrosine autokinase [Bacteroidia bacterium]
MLTLEDNKENIKIGEKIEDKLLNNIDITLILQLISNTKWIFFVLISITFLICFLLIRYSQAHYQSKSIIQINDNSGEQIIKLEDFSNQNKLQEAIEQIKSKFFLTRLIEKYDLNIFYYVEGTFKNNELYKQSPFFIKINIKDPFLYNSKFYVSFNKELKEGYITNGSQKFPFITDNWLKNKYFDLIIYQNPKMSASEISNVLNNNEKIYFTVTSKEEAANYLQSNLEVRVLNDAAKTILIKFTDVNKHKCSDIVNYIADEFLIYDVEKKSESAENILKFINEQLEFVYKDLKNIETGLQQFKLKYNVSDEDIYKNAKMIRISGIQEQLTKIELEDKIIEELLKELEKNKNIDIYQLISLISGTEYENIIKENIQNIQKLIAQKENILYAATPNSESIKSLNFQLETQKKMLIDGLNSIRLKYKTKYKNLLEKEYQIKSGNIKDPEAELELTRLNRLYGISEKYYTLLLEKKTEFSISKASYVSKNVILERSQSAGTKIKPNNKNIILTGISSTLLIWFGIIVVLYLMHNKIYSITDFMKIAQGHVNLLGVVPKTDESLNVSQLIVNRSTKSVVTESFRAIRSNISFFKGQESKIISVSSTISGEGKTFVAINIAGILAMADNKVLLIDLDLRKPKIHKGFGISNEKGMSTILAGIDKPPDCIIKHELEGLYLIPSGPPPPNPSELIISQKLKDFINEMKNIFDYIVIDNAPIGLVTDGIEAMKFADFPIYVFRSNYSKKEFIQSYIHLKEKYQISKLTAILNAIDLEKHLYGYNYGYGYAYGYGYGENYYTDSRKSKRKKHK